MFLRRLLRERLHVPSRIALLLGFGALSTGAQANAPETDVANPPIAASEREYIRSGEVLIRSDGTRKDWPAEAGGSTSGLDIDTREVKEGHTIHSLLASNSVRPGTALMVAPMKSMSELENEGRPVLRQLGRS